ELGKTSLQIRQQIDEQRNIEWTAFPKRRRFQSIANRLHEEGVFGTGRSALAERIVMRGLQRDISIAGPVVRERLAARLRTARAVGKNNDRILAWLAGIEDANVQIFIAPGIAHDYVGQLSNVVRPRLGLVGNGGLICNRASWAGRSGLGGSQGRTTLRQ